MSLKPKTVRRLTLAGAITSLLAAAAATLVAAGRWEAHRAGARLREAGMAEFRRGDYAAAERDLYGYLASAREDDDDALLAFAASRQRVGAADPHRLDEAIGAYERFLTRHPAELAASAALLQLYNRAGQFRLARDSAERLRPADLQLAGPQHVPILREEGAALLALSVRDPRLGQIASRLLELDGDDLRSHLLYTAWLIGAGRTEDAAAHVRRTLDLHPSDSRFELLSIITPGAGAGEDHDGIVRRLSALAGLDPDTGQRTRKVEYADSFYAARLAEGLDAVGEHSRAAAVLEDAAIRLGDQTLLRRWCRRAFQAGRMQELADHLASLDPALPGVDPAVLGFKALALHSLGRANDASAIAAQLRKRQADELAGAWASAIEGQITRPNTDVDASVASLRHAVERQDDEPVFHFLLGDALALRGPLEQARDQWAAAALSPRSIGWPAPWTRIAESLLAGGEPQDALRAAAAALDASPRDVESSVLWLRARTGVLTLAPGSDSAAQDPAGLLEDLERSLLELAKLPDRIAAAGFTAQLVPCRVAVLIRLGRADEARAAVLSAIASSPPRTIEQLRRLSAGAGLGIDEQCQQAAVQAYRALADSPSTAPGVLLEAAESLEALGDTAGARAALSAAEAIYRRDIAARDDAESHLGLAAARRQAGDDASAAAIYEGLLADRGTPAPLKLVIQNNLACSLVRTAATTADLERARTLASAAAAALRSPAAYDTLSRIELASGNRGAAIRACRAGLALQPDAPVLIVRLADVLSAGSEESRAEAAGLLVKLARIVDLTGWVPPSVAREMSAVRHRLDGFGQTAGSPPG